jgi:arsenate reductase
MSENYEKPAILFVCVHNSCRSQIAEGLFNAMSKKGKAISAGSDPSSRVSPKAVEVMNEIGIDISHQRPKLLTEDIVKNAEKAIIVCGDDSCPYIPGAEKWGVKDPDDLGIEEFRKTRDSIKEKIVRLISEINQNTS